MARQYKSYEEDFKKTVVKLYETGKGVSELSREYGVGKSTIESWIKKFKTITTSTGEKTNNDEILRLQKKNKELEQEIEILKKYMPEQLTDEEVTKIIEEAIKNNNATSNKEFGLVMKEITPKVKNRYDLSKASSIIKEKLNN